MSFVGWKLCGVIRYLQSWVWAKQGDILEASVPVILRTASGWGRGLLSHFEEK